MSKKVESAALAMMREHDEQMKRDAMPNLGEVKAMTQTGKIMEGLRAIPWQNLPAVEPWVAVEGDYIVEIQRVKEWFNNKTGFWNLIIEFKLLDEENECSYVHTMFLSLENDETRKEDKSYTPPMQYSLATLNTFGFELDNPNGYFALEGKNVKINVAVREGRDGRPFVNTYARRLG